MNQPNPKEQQMTDEPDVHVQITEYEVSALPDLPHRRYPCAACPWRKDVAPGQFPASRYEELRSTSEQRPGAEPGIGAPMFACHKTREGHEEACAGWLAAVGHRHIGVRFAVAQGRLPAEVLTPGNDWPQLFDTYEEMATQQAGDDKRIGEYLCSSGYAITPDTIGLDSREAQR